MSDYVIHQTCVEDDDAWSRSTIMRRLLSCPSCAQAWQKKFENSGSLGGRDFLEDSTFTHCDRCGRFKISRTGWYGLNSAGGNWPSTSRMDFSFHSEIKRFAINDNHVPIEALRRHLLDRYADIRAISAQKAEELVLSVFREHYGSAEVRYFRGTTYTADDGIDIVVVDVDRGTTGVQVKRRVSRATEPVMEIRSFITALFANGMRSGVYVALSSRLSKKARELPENEHLKEIGLSLKLVDCDAFYDMLNSHALRAAKPPWYSFLKDCRGFTDEPYVKNLLSRYSG